MANLSEDKLLVEIKRHTSRIFAKHKYDIATPSSGKSLKSFDLSSKSDSIDKASFLMADDDRGAKSYEGLKLSRPKKIKDEQTSRVVKVGSWRTLTGTMSLPGKLNEEAKTEMVKSILEELVAHIKSEYEMSISTQDESMNTARQLRKLTSFKERRLTYVSSTNMVSLSEFQRPVISEIVQDFGFPINISKAEQPFLEAEVQLDRVSLQPSVGLTGTISKEIPESSTSTESDESEKSVINSPFELKWCFGFNSDLPMVNLSTNDRSIILFANSQCPIIFDFHKHTMNFLHGHCNVVTSMAVDLMGSLIVTADSGPGSRVIVWDFRPCVVELLKEVHPKGTSLVGLTSYSEYLITVSPFPKQTVQIWIWHYDNKFPAATSILSDNMGEIKSLTINKSCAEEFALVSDNSVTFAFFDKRHFGGSVPIELILNSHQTPTKLGAVTGTTFLTGKNVTALCCTAIGYVIVWGEEEEEGSQSHKKVYKKHVRLQFERIIHIEEIDGMVAVATVSGNVSLFDKDLKILFWIKLKMGDIKSLSFNLTPPKPTVLECHSHNSCATTWHRDGKQLLDATLQANPIFVRHFVVCSTSGQLAYFNPTIGIPKNIFYPSPAPYTAISVFPDSNFLCAGTALGQCILFDLNDYKIKTIQKISVPENVCEGVACLQFSPSGFQLACGMYSGAVWLLHPLFLTPTTTSQTPLSQTSYCVVHLLFSPDSSYLAIADTASVVTLFSLQDEPKLLGRYQTHDKPIVDLLFVTHSSGFNLLSLGSDRTIIEFYIDGSIESKGLIFRMAHRVDQTATPYCMMPYPDDRKYFLMINSEFKFKLLDANTFKCCKTMQAPDLGYPIKSLTAFTTEGIRDRYMMFTTERHIGIHMLPVDGNPYRALACQASTTSIVCYKLHRNGKYVFTISENDNAINMWEINAQAVEDYYVNGGEGMDPFWNMLEGRKGGWRERDIRDFFMVGQFAHQGERPGVIRRQSNRLPVCEIASVFQALGFFPTKYQIDNVLYEVTGHDSQSLPPHLINKYIDLDQFVRLYVNHRPCEDLTVGDLQRAFCNLYQGAYYSDIGPGFLKGDTAPVFASESLIEQLLCTGEELSYGDLYVALSILTDREPERDTDESHMPIVNFLPKELTFEAFVNDLLGFDCETPAPFKTSQTANYSYYSDK